MDILKTLQAEEAENDAQIAALKVEGAKIRAAISAILNYENFPAQKAHPANMGINEAVIEAIKSGHRTPLPIHDFIKTHLGMKTTINSVRVRVSKLGTQKRIIRTAAGWEVPKIVKPSGTTPEGSIVTGKVSALPNEGPKP